MKVYTESRRVYVLIVCSALFMLAATTMVLQGETYGLLSDGDLANLHGASSVKVGCILDDVDCYNGPVTESCDWCDETMCPGSADYYSDETLEDGDWHWPEDPEERTNKQGMPDNIWRLCWRRYNCLSDLDLQINYACQEMGNCYLYPGEWCIDCRKGTATSNYKSYQKYTCDDP